MKIKRRPNLSVLVLISFIASFAAARTFTTLSPKTILLTGNLHIHHFWYGILMMAIGGWLGISYNDERINRLAAVIFGAGGGLIGDEAGLLLTFENYWTGLTYTIITGFLAVAFIMILIARYSKTIMAEFAGFMRRRASLYFGVFLATISIAFLIDTDSPIIIAASSASVAVACLIILIYLIQRISRKGES
ncbi:hypothetical protein MUP79_02150 [Candidatus Bathyarchaeota archaeon]|nr:hypothetical protein [Candidatus Bathyarchaeota archaeon]